MIFDAVAARGFSACQGLLEPGRVYVTTLPSLDVLLWGLVKRMIATVGTKNGAKMILVRPDADCLVFFAAWLMKASFGLR